MRLLLLLAGLLLWAATARGADVPAPAPRTIEQIRKEMTALRRSTAWDDAAAAKEANARLAQLAEEMLRVAKRPRPEDQASAAAAAANNTADPNAGGLDTAKLKQQFTLQAAEGIAGGRDSDMLLATKVREQIVEEYKADVDPTVKNPESLAEQTTLIIDFSSPAAQAIVDQMEKYRGINTLVLLSAKAGTAVDLAGVLRKARSYPLRELHIIGFGQMVTALPAEVAAFQNLRLLAAHNNALTSLPPAVAGMRDLETLLVDANPLPSVLPAVRSLTKLSKLGVGKTGVTAAEREEIRRLLPSCEVLTQ